MHFLSAERRPGRNARPFRIRGSHARAPSAVLRRLCHRHGEAMTLPHKGAAGGVLFTAK